MRTAMDGEKQEYTQHSLGSGQTSASLDAYTKPLPKDVRLVPRAKRNKLISTTANGWETLRVCARKNKNPLGLLASEFGKNPPTVRSRLHPAPLCSPNVEATNDDITGSHL
ncbi:hypothetical protein MHYP_G00272250 [Metynnis hypsauchen]